MVGDGDFLKLQRPESGKEREYGMLAQRQGIVNEDLGPAEPSTYAQHRPAQTGKRRARRIQTPEPSAQRGRVGHAIEIFDRGRRSFPGRPLDEIAAQRLAACGQAVMAVGRREGWQEGKRLAAPAAKIAANPDPIMVFIMSLFPPAPVTDDRILHAYRAAAQNDIRARLRPIGFALYYAVESEIINIVTTGGPLVTLAFPKVRTRGRDLHLASKIPSGKE